MSRSIGAFSIFFVKNVKLFKPIEQKYEQNYNHHPSNCIGKPPITEFQLANGIERSENYILEKILYSFKYLCHFLKFLLGKYTSNF